MAHQINHVDLTVTDMARSRAFYQPIMRYWGYEISSDRADEMVFSQADAAGVTSFALHPARPGSAGKRHDRYAPGLHHLAFDAASREEVDGLIAILQEIRAEILDPPAVYYEPDYYAVFFADPDGIKLEFAHTPSLKAGPPQKPATSLLRKIDCVMIKVDDLSEAGEF
jgi:glyoxylase I family protein